MISLNTAGYRVTPPLWLSVFPPNRLRLLVVCIFSLSVCATMPSKLQAAGVWTQLTNQNPAAGSGVMLLLTDGTVMVQGGGLTDVWNKLTPDSSGNYINGTWTTVARMTAQRLFFGSNVLPSGKMFVIGGEYSSEGGFTNSGEIYDPVANTWTRISTFPQPIYGDDPSVVLPNGKILCGFVADVQTYLYDPVADSWSQTGSKLRGDQSDEETWLQIPGGNIVSYDVFSSINLNQGRSQRYNAATGRWTDAGIVPVQLSSNALGAELGPGALLPDGRAFLVGANNLTAIYTPSTNSWVAGPKLPLGMGSDDAPGAMLPNGHFIFLADTSNPIFTPPTRLYDFDYTNDTVTDITPTTGPGPLFASSDAFPFRMVMLPNGHMLMSHRDTGVVWDYNPTGAPLTAWEPTISSVKKLGPTNSTTYTLTGTQLTGISEGACYGDDVEMATNYPIVRLKNSKGVVSFPRTTNWTPGVATGNALTTVQFTLPRGTPNDLYQISVSANGISSATQEFRVGPQVFSSNVTAVYNSGTKTLTLVGDNNPNSLTVSLQAGILKVEGANGTQINKTPSFSTAHSGKLVLVATMNDGDDAVSIIGVDSSTTNISLGAGNDKAAITLSHIQTLTIDGGPGIDALLTTSSTIGKPVETNIP